MLSIEKCKQILGAEAEGLTDENLKQLRRELYVLAAIALDMSETSKTSPVIDLTPGPDNASCVSGDGVPINPYMEAR